MQQLLHKLPWGHNLVLLDKLGTEQRCRWYAAKAIENNWSRNILVMQERIYIGRRFKNDSERLEKLFELYTKMTAAARSPTIAAKGKRAVR